MKVTPVTVSDLDAVKQIEDASFSLPWTYEQLQMMLDPGRFIFLGVFDDGGRLLGYAGMQYVLDEGYIGNVAVAADARRKGAGSLLMEEMLRKASELGLSFVTLEVRESNAAAIALYEKFGFEKVAVRKNYYDFPKENAIIMTVTFQEK